MARAAMLPPSAKFGKSAYDLTETWPAQDFRTARVLFVPSVKRGIFIFPRIGTILVGGARDDLYRTTRVHHSSRQRNGRMAGYVDRSPSRWAAASRCADA